MVDDSLKKLIQLRHRDPHTVLGARKDGDGVLVRVWRPEAAAVFVIPEGADSRVELRARRNCAGIFEAHLPKLKDFKYQLEVLYPQGQVFRFSDPYSFIPTLGDQDLHFIGEGRHHRVWEKMGARPMHHQGVFGTAFAVWAPSAEGVSVVGDFNSWDGRLHPMRSLGASGIWEIFIPDVGDGARYKFEIRIAGQSMPVLKADPYAFRTEVPPLTASVVHELKGYRWNDDAWMKRRPELGRQERPMSIYEVHPASWRRVPEDGNRPLTWREMAEPLANHVLKLGFTHVELLPIAEHPFGGSWGYQVSAYYAPTSRFGHPDDFRFFVDHLHSKGIGVLVDWVPGHFPRDAFALGRFDGTALYEHEDPRQGEHPDWGTFIFNFGRNEVRNFLIANALFWLDQYHVDGLRVDAVASMLYLDYSRPAGQWVPNAYGGRENLEAISFLKDLNETVQRQQPGCVVIAEESTAWPNVSRPVSQGGLGFSHKWNMGWMHDTLEYFRRDPIYRQHHHHQLTFGLVYAFSENFVLPLSHDEVVHGKGSLLNKMPGDTWQKFANLRALYAWMWAHPGKKLLFMGAEIGQWREWNHDSSLDWHLLEDEKHAGLSKVLSRCNSVYRDQPALFETDFNGEGFRWIQANQEQLNVYAFVRRNGTPEKDVVCIANLSPTVHHDYRLGVPSAGKWIECLNTDAAEYGGSGVHCGSLDAHDVAWDGQPASLLMSLPPLSVVWLRKH